MSFARRARLLNVGLLSVCLNVTPCEAKSATIDPLASPADQARDQARDQAQGGLHAHQGSLRVESARAALLREGQALGVSVEYLYDLWRSTPTRGASLRADSAWRGGLGLSLGTRSVSEGSLGWEVSHLETRGALLGSISRSMGLGSVGLVCNLGAISVLEERVRHQSQRFMTAGLESDLTDALIQSAHAWVWSVSLRPQAQLEVMQTRAGSSEVKIGVTLSGELEYRLIPTDLSARLGDPNPLGWGISAGVSMRWGR